MPRRYEERTRIGFSVRQFAMSFDDGRAVLANGATVPMRAGMQDASSQFVQLSYLFTTNPSLLQPGRSVSLPVALPRRLDNWIYDVVGEETLATPIGDLRTFHVRPRRESPRQGELVAQAWYAPSLQYLPVRILIHQDADNFIDMKLDSAPLCKPSSSRARRCAWRERSAPQPTRGCSTTPGRRSRAAAPVLRVSAPFDLHADALAIGPTRSVSSRTASR